MSGGKVVAWLTAQSPFGVKVQPARGERPQHATDLVLQSALAAAIARAEAAEADVRRLDWLDREAHCADWDTAGREVMKRVIQADDGTETCADTWREAIDAAIAAQQAEGEDRG